MYGQSTPTCHFLDRHKAYDTTDRERLLDTFDWYGVGVGVCGLIKEFWDLQLIVTNKQTIMAQPSQPLMATYKEG